MVGWPYYGSLGRVPLRPSALVPPLNPYRNLSQTTRGVQFIFRETSKSAMTQRGEPVIAEQNFA
jgi:hypothetical protein